MDFANPGDLIFFEMGESSEFAEAVAAVGRTKVIHVGIVTEDNTIVHATEAGVVEQTLPQAIVKVDPIALEVVRVLKTAADKLSASQFARTKVGLPYNDLFMPSCKNSDGVEAYYCSQLITEAYKNVDMPWPHHDLTFCNENGDILEFWVEYYAKRNQRVPHGEPGSHPSQLRRASCFQTLMKFSASSFLVGTNVLESGHWVGGRALNFKSPQAIKVFEPRSGKKLTTWNAATKEQVNDIVGGAHAAQKKWASTTWLQRSNVLCNVAELLRKNCDEIAHWESIDNGKPVTEARADVLSCVETFTFYSGVAHGLLGSHVPIDSTRFAYTKRIPLGVVACIGAWNYPIQTCTWKTAPALACGNAVVYKPSPMCPVSALILARALKEAGLPDGVFNVVQGDVETATALIEHESVAKVSFTGSILTGKKIMQMCAGRRIKPVTMELGGKSALVVFEDADLDSAVACAMMANFFSQGQVCSNASKVIVHKSLLQEFTKRLVEKTKALKVGDPLLDETRVGAHVSATHRDKVKDYITGAVKQGAKVVCGGVKVGVPGFEDGFYLSPCILSNVDKNMTVYKEEIFGSVLLLIPFDIEEEAISMANDTSMGLAAGLVTKDLSRAHRVADLLHAGNVYINTYNDVSPLVPFGGFGESGFGRENGLAVLEHYTQTKSVFVNTSTCENPF